MSKDFILVEFKDGKASFDIRLSNDVQMIMALTALEGYLAAQSGLATEDIREMIDEAKGGLTIRPKDEECK